MGRFSALGSKTFSGRKPYILFLCTGNTCRSPMAKGCLEQFLKEAGIDNIEVRTAGVMTIPGLMPTQECRHLLLKDGIDISSHRSCQLTEAIIEKAHMVLGMTSFHVQTALRMTEKAKNKTFLLKEYTGSDPKNGQIQDPMGCTLEVYKKVYREIKSACKKLVKMDLLNPGSKKPLKKSKPLSKQVTKKLPSKPLIIPDASGLAEDQAIVSVTEDMSIKSKKKKPAAKKSAPKKAAKTVGTKKSAPGKASAKAKPAAEAKKPAVKTAKKTTKKAAPKARTKSKTPKTLSPKKTTKKGSRKK